MTAIDITPTNGAILIVAVMVTLFVLIFLFSMQQARRGVNPHAPRPEGVEPEPAAAKARPLVSRRDFFRGGLIGSLLLFGAQFGGASIAFLWPNLKGQFGSKITVGSVSDIKAAIDSQNQPFYYGAGRFYIVPYNGTGASTIYKGLTQEGLMALYQRCVHLGCRVPFCQASQWFECPCHGSKYNEAGEYQLGPAPHGMDRFPLTISNDIVSVDTSNQVLGPPRGTNTTNQAPEGPFCVGGSAGG
jgi:cytochrome b6-f complex iron-sulfur subunit